MQDTELTILAYVNKARVVFMFRFVQYTLKNIKLIFRFEHKQTGPSVYNNYFRSKPRILF